MNWASIPGTVNDLLKSFYTLNEKLERLQADMKTLGSEIDALSKDHIDLKMRVGILEEGRKTIDAQVRAEITATIAELRVRFAEVQAHARTNPSELLPPSEIDGK